MTPKVPKTKKMKFSIVKLLFILSFQVYGTLIANFNGRLTNVRTQMWIKDRLCVDYFMLKRQKKQDACDEKFSEIRKLCDPRGRCLKVKKRCHWVDKILGKCSTKPELIPIVRRSHICNESLLC